MKVPLFDLSRQHQPLENQFLKAFQQVVQHGKFILGPEVELFEKEIAAACQSKHAISCASGSDALLLALMACDIGSGDEVITSSYSFFATASCIARVGARAVFAEIDPITYNLDPADVLRKISPKTKAIIPVHLYGQSAEMTPYLSICRERGIRIIEDVAQSIGAEHRGKPVGVIGDIGCYSFFPTKNLGGLGDGGMLLAQDTSLAEKLRILRVHGAHPKYHHDLLGVNSRLDTLQAAMLRVKLPHLNSWAEARIQNAQIYIEALTKAGVGEFDLKGTKPVILPAALQSRHVYNQFVIRTRDPETRDALRTHLEKQGVGTEIYYPIPLHLQKCFSLWGYRTGELPLTELACRSTIALPVFPELQKDEILHVAKQIQDFYSKAIH